MYLNSILKEFFIDIQVKHNDIYKHVLDHNTQFPYKCFVYIYLRIDNHRLLNVSYYYIYNLCIFFIIILYSILRYFIT